VRDEEIGEPVLLAQIEQQVDHLRGHGDVERRDRLVADEELRPVASARAIAIRCRCPPEKLVRVAPGRLARETDFGEELFDARPGVPAVASP
jgi:hypothetical protein